MFEDLNFARFYYNGVRQSVILPFFRRYIVVYRRIVGRNLVSTSIFLSSF